MSNIDRILNEQECAQAYILGIKEGRAHLNAFPELKGDKETIRTLADNAAILMRSHSGDMRDMFKGERDFWRQQLKG